MNCKYCHQELPTQRPGGHRPREYCNNAHRQAYYRRQLHHPAASDEALIRQLKEKQTRIEELEQHIEELVSQNIRLQERLDVEKRYLTDDEQRGFKFWLKDYIKKYRSSPLIERLLADQFFRPRGTRKQYEDFLRNRLRATDEELREFADLWKFMLLTAIT